MYLAPLLVFMKILLIFVYIGHYNSNSTLLRRGYLEKKIDNIELRSKKVRNVIGKKVSRIALCMLKLCEL